MFLRPYKIKSNQLLRRTDIKRLRQRIERSFLHLKVEQLQHLLPNKANVSTSKLLTYGKSKTRVFYIRQLPMFFEIGGTLVPTLYAIGMVPNLLPCFSSFPSVLPELINGSDLMLQSIKPQGSGRYMYGNYKKGQLVAVNLTSFGVAVGVGFLAHSSDYLNMEGNCKTAIKILHFFGDKLWANVPILKLPVPADVPNEVLPVLSPASTEDDSTAHSSDLILRNAFLAALRNEGENMQLPLLVSRFYRMYVVPEAQKRIDLRKTKYKKFSNFLYEMIDQGFLSLREETEGVYTIFAINFKHPELLKLKTDRKRQMVTNATKPMFSSKLAEMYKVTDKVVPFFVKLGYKCGDSILKGQIKKIVDKYTNMHNLSTLDSRKKLNTLYLSLQEVCECSCAPSSKIYNLILEKMVLSYEIRNVKDTGDQKRLINIFLARAKNHTVTIITNIECYGIIVSKFVKLCKKGAAANTALVKLPYEKCNALQIQGNQIQFVYALLTKTYKLSRKCIQFVVKYKDNKNKKRNHIIKRHKIQLLKVIYEKENYFVDSKYDSRKIRFTIFPLSGNEVFSSDIVWKNDHISRQSNLKVTFGDFLIPPLRCEPEKVVERVNRSKPKKRPKSQPKPKQHLKSRPKQ